MDLFESAKQHGNKAKVGALACFVLACALLAASLIMPPPAHVAADWRTTTGSVSPAR